jgi:hypothetical protein
LGVREGFFDILTDSKIRSRTLRSMGTQDLAMIAAVAII